MAVRWVERFQIYVLSVGNLAAGASIVDLPLPLDSDAPFVLRGRGGRCQYNPQTFQAPMNGLLTRFRDASGNYKSDAPVPWYLDVPGGGYGGQWQPNYPQDVYPPQGQLLTSLYNTGPNAENLTNLQLYYVGTKRFPPGTPYDTYPVNCSPKDYGYSYWSKSPTRPNLPFQNALMAPNATLLNIPITIQTDSDFALRSGQCGIYGIPSIAPDYEPYFYMELFILLMDRWRKPYMNAPVHVDWLFGGGSRSFPSGSTGGIGATNPFYYPNNTESLITSLPGLTSGIIPGQVPLSGNWHPGLFFPELYLKANTQLYFNLYRNDAQFTTGYNPDPVVIVPPDINFHIAFTGSKVFHR